ncbi:hypothetical protein BaRGS_00018194 [Batillaria attramentaria]|uniref:DDE Tnp4 domain-containing protein n=1 Tax=Batillaria attramentaria TaxID=370345 RepID=A0ABD0KU17_9CAEN
MCAYKLRQSQAQITTITRLFFSIVLQGIADPQLRFLCVEVEAYGKESDGGIFGRSAIKKTLEGNTVNLPEEVPLPDSDVSLPLFLVGDSAYPPRPYLMTRINTNLTHDRKIFNYRHSRARCCIECAFGVLAGKWRVLKTTICVKVTTAEKIVLAAVALHNAVINHEGASREKDIPIWDDSHVRARERHVVAHPGRPGQHAAWVREQLVQYFVGAGAVTWQENYI